MIVVDCTVLANFFIGTPELREPAEFLLEMDSDWISPILWRYEFGYVLRSEVCSGKISSGLMGRYQRAAETLMPESVVHLEVEAVGKLAISCDLSFYDASYV